MSKRDDYICDVCGEHADADEVMLVRVKRKHAIYELGFVWGQWGHDEVAICQCCRNTLRNLIRAEREKE